MGVFIVGSDVTSVVVPVAVGCNLDIIHAVYDELQLT